VVQNLQIAESSLFIFSSFKSDTHQEKTSEWRKAF